MLWSMRAARATKSVSKEVMMIPGVGGMGRVEPCEVTAIQSEDGATGGNSEGKHVRIG